MARKRSKNQDFHSLFKSVSNFITENGFIEDLGNASRISFRDDCDDTCLDCQTFSESRPDPKRPGKSIVVLVRRCVR